MTPLTEKQTRVLLAYATYNHVHFSSFRSEASDLIDRAQAGSDDPRLALGRYDDMCSYLNQKFGEVRGFDGIGYLIGDDEAFRVPGFEPEIVLDRGVPIASSDRPTYLNMVLYKLATHCSVARMKIVAGAAVHDADYAELRELVGQAAELTTLLDGLIKGLLVAGAE